MASELDEARYVALTTYRRDGSAVATPVWLAPSERGYYVVTTADTGKMKRIRNNRTVTVAVCNARGVVASDAPVHAGTAEILDERGVAAADAAIRGRYGLIAKIVGLFETVSAKLRRRDVAARSAIEITIDPPS